MLTELLNQRIVLYKKQYQIKNELSKLITDLKELENKIMESCDHQWIIDRESVYGPYTKPDKICEICKTIKYSN